MGSGQSKYPSVPSRDLTDPWDDIKGLSDSLPNTPCDKIGKTKGLDKRFEKVFGSKPRVEDIESKRRAGLGRWDSNDSLGETEELHRRFKELTGKKASTAEIELNRRWKNRNEWGYHKNKGIVDVFGLSPKSSQEKGSKSGISSNVLASTSGISSLGTGSSSDNNAYSAPEYRQAYNSKPGGSEGQPSRPESDDQNEFGSWVFSSLAGTGNYGPPRRNKRYYTPKNMDRVRQDTRIRNAYANQVLENANALMEAEYEMKHEERTYYIVKTTSYGDSSPNPYPEPEDHRPDPCIIS